MVLDGAGSNINDIYFSPNGRRLAADFDKFVRIWDTEIEKELMVLNKHSETIKKSYVSTNMAGCCGKNQEVRLRSPFHGTVTFSADGRRLASGSGDHTVRIWDTETGNEMIIFEGHQNIVASVSFSPDGKRLASGSFDKTVRIWDTDNKKEVKNFKGHSDEVFSVSFSRDSRRIASSSNDNPSCDL